MANKSAKDLAFEKERVKYRKQIRELEAALRQKDVQILEERERAHAAEQKCVELQDWINRLLEYMELSEEDMKRLIQKEKDAAKVMEHFNGMFDLMGRFGGVYGSK